MCAAVTVMKQPGMFKHQALDLNKRQIRLIKIIPVSSNQQGASSEAIHCSIQTFDMDTELTYTALSYVWGPPEPCDGILLNGVEFIVRSNLYGFLLQARSLGLKEYFWIDQLSIDQADLGERNHQVAMMANIYRGATRTICWLGSDLPADLGARIFTSKDKSITAPEKARAWKFVFESTYWTRLWVVQEICLSRKVEFLIREVMLSWRNIRIWSTSLDVEPTDFGLRILSLYGMQSHQWNKPLEGLAAIPSELWPSFYCSFLRLCSVLKCADPKDYVYGLGSLLEGGKDFRPDYSLTVEDVFEGLVQSDLCKVNDWDELIDYMQLCWTFLKAMGLRDREDIILKLNVRSEGGPGSQFWSRHRDTAALLADSRL
ncbi:HET-domain-containing protein [Microthyrium microscopicum]|uniref:HET-domain-containing protein n=1 Tax=Microthyrium microscopicum TaxID=703497 RepID=A0A6A6U7R1_9PEZI|nr:HET-domain-containing protein [Microthyrium microscopicum]